MFARRFVGAFLVTILVAGIGETTGLLRFGAGGAESLPGALATERVQARIVRALHSANPRLDGWTRERIARAILRCSGNQGLDPDLVLAILLVESSGRPAARSPKGAVGLMQVMPHMFRILDLPGSVAHVEANIEAGCVLLADNIHRLGEERGISAYFWGSSIRGEGYLRRVRSMRDALWQAPTAEDSPSGG